MSDDNAGSSMQALQDYLAALPPGSVQDTGELVPLLKDCWEHFEGSSAERMDGSKLPTRMNQVVWQPPVLQFEIDRHGATVRGSTRAALHRWRLNVEDRTADWVKVGHRQLEPMQPPFRVNPLAEDISRAIIDHQEDERLRRLQDGTVKVLIGKVLPKGSAAKETLEGRRRRFHDALRERMQAAGWRRLGTDVYGPPVSQPLSR